MAAIYLPENKLHPFVTQTQNEMHLKGKGSATGTMEIVLGMEKQEHLRVNVAPDQTIRSTAQTQNEGRETVSCDKPKKNPDSFDTVRKLGNDLEKSRWFLHRMENGK